MGDTVDRHRRPWARRLATAVLAVLVGVVASAWLIGGQAIRTYPRDVGAPPADLLAEDVELPGRWGRLSGWRVGEFGDRSCVLLLHGIGADRRAMLSRARMFDRAGYGVLLLDQQGHGESHGSAVAFGARARWDAITGVTALRGWGCSKVAVLGVSMGGAAALLAGDALEADAVIVEQVYARLEEAAEARFRHRLGPAGPWVSQVLMLQLGPRLGLTLADVRPVHGIQDLSAPTLLVAGEADWRAPPEDAQELAEQGGGPTEVWIVEGAGHESLHQRLGPAYEQRVLQFLSRWMTPAS